LVLLAPRVSGFEAADRARAAFAVQVPNGLVFAGPESLVLFDPAVLDEPGEPGLVWEMEVFDQDHETLKDYAPFYGYCRKNPPILYQAPENKNQWFGAWPLVDQNDFCGNFSGGGQK